jgi:acyl-CoA reductase-like NAD-dependent aldehyde dehydrogenase
MARLEVLKTYKIYIGGQFPRTESGHYYPVTLIDGSVTNICLCSRKDVRDAVVAARNAFSGWSGRTAFNRSQILYRVAEMLEGRRAQFVSELQQGSATLAQATMEVDAAIDRCVHFAGWCDKYSQLFSSVNPVASSHFNFSVHEPSGVATVVAPQAPALLGLVSVIMPIIAGGNSCVVLASEELPHTAVTFAEVLNNSDLPGGVVNILTGKVTDLAVHLASHMDVNACVNARAGLSLWPKMQDQGAANVKRMIDWSTRDWTLEGEDPYLILDTQELKTTWHPIENIGPAKAGY